MGAASSRNEKCSCGSGKKYKKCHFLREQEPPLRMSEVLAAEKDALSRKCLHPATSDCQGSIVSAHTVQRALLEQIADQGHVLGLKRGLASFKKNGGSLKLEKIGISKASTFTGFCALHDKTTFAPIEDAPIETERRHAFLLAYRAISHELYSKEYQRALSLDLLPHMDKGRPPEVQESYQSFVRDYGCAVDVGLRDLRHHKSRYDRELLNGTMDNVRAAFVRFDGSPPFMVNGAFFPECSFSGEALQNLADQEAVLQAMGFSVVVSNGKGLGVFSWLDDSANDSCPRLIDSLLSLDRHLLADAIMRFAFEFFENVYVDPRWWHGLSRSQQDLIMSRLRRGVSPFNDRRSDCLADDGLRVFGRAVEDVVRL